MAVVKRAFGSLPDGREASLYEISNSNGMLVSVSDYGGTIVALCVPDKNDELRDVVLGFDSVTPYEFSYFGKTVGRFANRIRAGRFVLDGKEYQLEKNENNKNHLHGGIKGFCRRFWNVEVSESGLILTVNSPEGEGGYPGDLRVRMVYKLAEDNTLRIDYYAETESKTICNLTNHSYFNLNGHYGGDIYGHEIQLNAGFFTPVDNELIPTGELANVAGTTFDFRKSRNMGEAISAAGGGYDHNFVLDCPGTAAVAYSPESGIKMTVKTNSPGLQFFTANGVNDLKGKVGAVYNKHNGFCMETQLFPDAVNQPDFPSCVVEKGKPQEYFTEFIFNTI